MWIVCMSNRYKLPSNVGMLMESGGGTEVLNLNC